MAVGTNVTVETLCVCVAYFCADLCCAADREGEDVFFGHCCDDGCLSCFQPTLTNLFTIEEEASEHSPHCGRSLKTATLPKPDNHGEGESSP